MIPVRLWNAYTATTFSADVQGVNVHLRVGAAHPDLDRLLSERGVGSWAYISAWNPRSDVLNANENDVRHQQLQDAIAVLGLDAFEGWGEPDQPDWSPERSLLLFGISELDAMALGRRFGQHAIVVGTRGEAARLVPCLDDAGTEGVDAR